MQFPITIGLRRSFLAWLLPLLGCCAALLMAWLLPIPVAVRGAMIALAVLLGVAALVRQSPFRQPLHALRLAADGSVSVALAGTPDYFLPALVLPGATVHRWLTVVRLQAGGRTYPLVLTPEAIAPDDFRRFRVFLRWLVKFTGPDVAA